MDVSNLSSFNLWLLRSYCSGVLWIAELFWVDTSLLLMRPLTDCLSQSILLMTLGSWEHPPTQSYLENSLINSVKLTQIGHFFCWRRHTYFGSRDRVRCCSKTLCPSCFWGLGLDVNLFLKYSTHFLDPLKGYFVTSIAVLFKIKIPWLIEPTQMFLLACSIIIIGIKIMIPKCLQQ